MSGSAAGERLIIITAPSGSGKSTLVRYLLREMPSLAFSVSACTRKPRVGEVDGESYYFISVDAFKEHIAHNDFAEYEMVYEGKYYGTLNSELTRIWNNQQYPLVDIDVKGAIRLKSKFGNNALSLFLKAPSMAELERRLRGRGTETEESLRERLNKAEEELSYSDRFDACIINDQIEVACEEAHKRILKFLTY